MTLPSADNPILIFIPSFIIAPVAHVFFNLSEPAKSTKWNLEVINPVDPSSGAF